MMGDRKKAYKEYIKSPAWAQIKRTMPGDKACLACGTNRRLHLHHMYYSPNIWDTKPCHCCWLCARCHKAFHKARPNGIFEVMDLTWEQLREETRRIILRKLTPSYRVEITREEMKAFQFAMDRD